jgi:hypothetical protein
LAAAVGIDIEGEINHARATAQLLKLVSVEMGAQRAGEVAKTCLPQHGIVEQPLIGALSSGVDPTRSRPEAELLPPEAKNPTEREYSFSPMTL